MWNKQRYCRQIQSHVRIQNFRGRNGKITMFGKSAYFFVVLWHGRACPEMCGTILWVGKEGRLNNSTKYQLHALMTITSKKKNWNPWENCQMYASQIVLKCLYLASIGRPDILWSVNKLARSITKWTKGLWQTITSLDLLHSSYMWVQTVLSCGKHCQTMQTGTVARLRFCERSWWIRNLLRVELCAFLEVIRRFR